MRYLVSLFRDDIANTERWREGISVLSLLRGPMKTTLEIPDPLGKRTARSAATAEKGSAGFGRSSTSWTYAQE